MLVGIHTDQYGKFRPYLERYEKILDYNNIDHIRLEASDLNFWEKVKGVDLFIFNWAHYDWSKQLARTILPIIENELGINCFPNQQTCWAYDDKIREYYLLKQHGFPIIESYIFWDRKKALEWAEKANYPIVFKLAGGAGSTNVILIKNKNQAFKYIKRMFGKGINPNKFKFSGSTYKQDVKFYKRIHKVGGNILRKINNEDQFRFWQIHKNYILFQEFLPNNDFDTRVVVIGNRIYAFRRFVRKGDFRASGSGKMDLNKNDIDLNFLKIAFNISIFFQFQSMAYDFIYDPFGNPALIEISYAYPDLPSFSDGYWDVDLIWHEGHFCPQYFQLADAMKMPELKLP